MYAIIETGGKQYAASAGERIRVERLSGDVGDQVELGKVVAVSDADGKMLTGSAAAAAKVTGTIAGHGRGNKIIVFRFKRRKMERRRIGHRQGYTTVQIDDIAV